MGNTYAQGVRHPHEEFYRVTAQEKKEEKKKKEKEKEKEKERKPGPKGRMRMRRSLAALFCLGLLLLAKNSSAGRLCPSSLGEEEERLSRIFPPLDSGQHLFAVEGDYVLQAVCADDNGLTEIRLVPRYFLQDTHPEWTEPGSPVVMSLARYEDLLRRIQTVKPLGNLIREGHVGLTLNLRTSFVDQYAKAIVEKSMLPDSPEGAYSVASFRVAYFHTVCGKLESMEASSPETSEQMYRIKVNGKWYWTTQREFKRLREGQEVSVQAAGPISFKI